MAKCCCRSTKPQARAALGTVRAAGIDALAIVLMHGWRYPDHEARLAEIARELGFTQVSVSHEVAPLIKLIGRGDTTVVDAYLSPVLRRYVDRVAAGLPAGTDLHFMQSNGGLAEAQCVPRQGRDPVRTGGRRGRHGRGERAARAPTSLIGFDMGGTSTDVSHYAGQFELADESVVAGVRIRAPMMQIHTVAAGGGSICRFDGMRFRVGPEVAGREPGPGLLPQRRAADRDRLQPVPRPDRPRAHFPPCSDPSGDQPLDPAASRARLRGDRRRARRPKSARGNRRRFPRHRGRQHGRRDPQDLDRARP